MPETYSSPVQCFKDIIKYEGVAGLYKGLAAPVFAQFFIGSLSFAANSITMNLLEPNLKKGEAGSPRNSFIAGCVGGFAQCLVLVPTDLVKCKMQVDQVGTGSGLSGSKYASSIDCAKQIYKKERIPGFFRGFVTTACREVPAFGTYFAAYSNLLDYLTPKNTPPSATSILVSGGIAGSLSWAIVYPVDVVKSNIQIATSPDPLIKDPHGLYSMSLSLYHKYGWRIFFRGMGTAVVRAFPVNSIVFYCYELFRGHLGI